ncbi:hypothetical protein [Roseivirga pacifica]|uniref:hypothetical protein n=1 Tax=Roseivirga pacifica TaxID=1267423 RepID=UPI00227B11D2|nr:hypothetical protein [Roseivirga pacifica]
MNKKKRLIFPPLIVLFLIAFAVYQHFNSDSYVVSEGFQLNIETEGNGYGFEGEEGPESENPKKRLMFEFNRLKNPKTGLIPEGIRLKELSFMETNYKRSIATLQKPSSSEMSASAFYNRGPFNVGGRTRALAFDINNENILLAGGISGGVWRSTNQGQSWTRASRLDQHPAVSAIVQDQRNGHTNEWYYATGERSGNSANVENSSFYRGNGVYKSVDNGVTWSLISSTAAAGTSGTDVLTSFTAFSLVDELAIDLSNATGTEIYAAGLGRIIRSTDGFQTYNIVLGANNDISNMSDVAISSAGKVFATIGSQFNNGSAGEDGVFMSDDGISWIEITPDTGFDGEFRMKLEIDPQNEDHVWLLGSDKIMRYTVSTDTWEDRSNALGFSSNVRNGYNSQGGYDMYVKVHPDNSQNMFVGGTNILRSTSAFSNSTNRDQIGGYGNTNDGFYPEHHPDQHVLTFFNSNASVALSGSDGGVHITSDILADDGSEFPVTWQSLNNGYLTTQFYHIALYRSNLADPFLVGGLQDNGTFLSQSEDGAADWIQIGGGDGANAAFTYSGIYNSSQNGFLIRIPIENQAIKNEFLNISPISDSDEQEENFLFINPYTYNPVRPDQFFVAALEKVFYTNDVRNNPGDGEWNEITSDELTGTNENVSAFAVSMDPEGVLFFGTDGGQVFKLSGLHELNGNVTATAVGGADLPAGYVTGIAVNPKDGDHVIVTYSNYGIVSIWESTDGGENWSSISGNLEENPDGSGAGPSIRSVEIMPDGNGGSYYFVGTSVGLFMTQTLDGDNTIWEQQGADVIGNVVVSSIAIRPIEGRVVAATHGNGVFQGNYDVGLNPEIFYAVENSGQEFVLRANGSLDANTPFAYQWIKNGEPIDGANNSELTVTEGGSYQVRLFISQTESALSNTVFVNLDSEAPVLNSIARLLPLEEETSASSVLFELTFSENVINVDVSDFEVGGDVSGTIAEVTELSPSTYLVDVSNIGGAGLLDLNLSSAMNITDEAGNDLSTAIGSEETYTVVDVVGPTATISRLSPANEITNQAEVTFQVAFNEPVVNVTLDDFELSIGSVVANLSAINEVTAGRIFSIEVVEIEEDGLIDLDILITGDIEDASGNGFAGTITSEETYTIENIITSIEGDPSYVGDILAGPNPSTGIFELTFPSYFSGDFSLVIVGLNGQKVTDLDMEGHVAGEAVEVDITNSPDGVYMLRAEKNGKFASVKLLKQSR